MIQRWVLFFHNTPILHCSSTPVESYPIILNPLQIVTLLLFVGLHIHKGLQHLTNLTGRRHICKIGNIIPQSRTMFGNTPVVPV